jgi:hypothetical protein
MEVVTSTGPSDTTATATDTTVRLRRKVARRTESWYPQPPPPPPQLRRITGEIGLQLPTYLASPPPQAEDIPAARKKRRLEEPFPTTKAITTDEAARKTASSDISVGPPLPPPAAYGADGDIDDATTDTYPVSDTQPNAVATPVRNRRRWTLEEDAKLTSAVTNTSKMKHSREYMTDWVAISALVTGRTRSQCRSRWHELLDPNIDSANERTGKWTADEDSKLKDAVQTHGGKNWSLIAALVPGVMSSIPASTERLLDVQVNGQKTRTAS